MNLKLCLCSFYIRLDIRDQGELQNDLFVREKSTELINLFSWHNALWDLKLVAGFSSSGSE